MMVCIIDLAWHGFYTGCLYWFGNGMFICIHGDHFKSFEQLLLFYKKD